MESALTGLGGGSRGIEKPSAFLPNTLKHRYSPFPPPLPASSFPSCASQRDLRHNVIGRIHGVCLSADGKYFVAAVKLDGGDKQKEKRRKSTATRRGRRRGVRGHLKRKKETEGSEMSDASLGDSQAERIAYSQRQMANDRLSSPPAAQDEAGHSVDVEDHKVMSMPPPEGEEVDREETGREENRPEDLTPHLDAGSERRKRRNTFNGDESDNLVHIVLYQSLMKEPLATLAILPVVEDISRPSEPTPSSSSLATPLPGDIQLPITLLFADDDYTLLVFTPSYLLSFELNNLTAARDSPSGTEPAPQPQQQVEREHQQHPSPRVSSFPPPHGFPFCTRRFYPSSSQLLFGSNHSMPILIGATSREWKVLSMGRVSSPRPNAMTTTEAEPPYTSLPLQGLYVLTIPRSVDECIVMTPVDPEFITKAERAEELTYGKVNIAATKDVTDKALSSTALTGSSAAASSSCTWCLHPICSPPSTSSPPEDSGSSYSPFSPFQESSCSLPRPFPHTSPSPSTPLPLPQFPSLRSGGVAVSSSGRIIIVTSEGRIVHKSEARHISNIRGVVCSPRRDPRSDALEGEDLLVLFSERKVAINQLIVSSPVSSSPAIPEGSDDPNTAATSSGSHSTVSLSSRVTSFTAVATLTQQKSEITTVFLWPRAFSVELLVATRSKEGACIRYFSIDCHGSSAGSHSRDRGNGKARLIAEVTASGLPCIARFAMLPEPHGLLVNTHSGIVFLLRSAASSQHSWEEFVSGFTRINQNIEYVEPMDGLKNENGRLGSGNDSDKDKEICGNFDDPVEILQKRRDREFADVKASRSRLRRLLESHEDNDTKKSNSGNASSTMTDTENTSMQSEEESINSTSFRRQKELPTPCIEFFKPIVISHPHRARPPYGRGYAFLDIDNFTQHSESSSDTPEVEEVLPQFSSSPFVKNLFTSHLRAVRIASTL